MLPVKLDLKDPKRSNEVSLTFKVTNTSESPVIIGRIIPRIPSGAVLVDTLQQSLRCQRRVQELCDELTSIVDAELKRKIRIVYSAELKGDLTSLVTAAVRIVLPIVLVYARENNTGIGNGIGDTLGRFQHAWRFQVESGDDARYAIEHLLADSDATIQRIFRAKLEQLKTCESELQAAKSHRELGRDLTEETTFIVRVPRGHFGTRKYKIEVECEYQRGSDSLLRTSQASQECAIEPHFGFLIALSILGSLLGVALRCGLVHSKTAPGESFEQILRQSLLGADGLAAAILALFALLTYEYVETEKFDKIGTNWRGSLTIGLVVGLFQDKSLAALTAFFGV